VSVIESPEIAAVMRRIGWAKARDFDTYSNLISDSPHFRGIGSDIHEFWDSAEKFLTVRRIQAEELTGQGFPQAEATIERLEAFEQGDVGWASMLLTIRTPDGDVSLRVTAVLVLDSGVWRVVQWHNSVPSPNVETFGIELTTTLDELLDSVAGDADAMGTLEASEGTMTLVFTDIVDSTVMAERIGDEAWVALVHLHESDIRRSTARHGGTVVKMLGDGSMLAFTSARAAVRAALELLDTTQGNGYEIRIGIHAGEVVRQEEDLLGITVNKAARIASVAGAGQVLTSALVAELIGSIEGVVIGTPMNVSLRGLSGTHALVPVESDKPQT